MAPVDEFMVPIAVLLLLQLPPPAVLENVVVPPGHIVLVPVTEAIAELTVTVVVVSQPATNLYVIIAVPVATPVTIPVADPTDAFAVALLDQVPPGTDAVNGTLLPTHMVPLPVIVPAEVFTVTTREIAQPVDDNI